MARWWTRTDQSPCRTSRIGEHRARFLKQTHQPRPATLASVHLSDALRLSLSLSLSHARALTLHFVPSSPNGVKRREYLEHVERERGGGRKDLRSEPKRLTES